MSRNTIIKEEELNYKFNFSFILRVLKYAVPFKYVFLGIFLLVLFSSGMSLLTPYMRKFLVDDFILKGNYTVFYYVIIATIAVGLTEIIAAFISRLMLTKTGHKIIIKIREDVFGRLQQLSFNYFDNRPTGKIVVRVTSYVDELAVFFSNYIIDITVNATKILLVFVFMFALDYRLALVIAAIFVPLFIFIYLMRKLFAYKLRKQRNYDSSRVACIHENIMGHTIINSFNRKDKNVDFYIDEIYARCKKSWLGFIRVNELFGPGVEMFFSYGFLFLCLASFFFIKNDTLTLGVFISFNGYTSYLGGPVSSLAACLQQLSIVSSYLERIIDLIDTEEPLKDEENAAELPSITGSVEFKNVDFCYEKDRLILENFNLSVKAGECIALVGPTGGGKSTVVNLISRFYDVCGGNIYIDGTDVKTVTLKSLRSQMGVMMQDSFIFKDTVIENIRYGKPGASDEECIAAAKAAYADEFISKMPKGYYTELNEKGEGLSTGERQLLSFARVIIRNPKILILDEATSSIDTQTELKIQRVLNELLKGRTSFIIAHRLSTIKKADRIIYICDKNIRESGNHEELMAKKGLYYKLAKKH